MPSSVLLFVAQVLGYQLPGPLLQEVSVSLSQAACPRLSAILTTCGASYLWPALAGRRKCLALWILFAVQASFSKKDAELSSNIVQDACGKGFLNRGTASKLHLFKHQSLFKDSETSSSSLLTYGKPK